MKKINILFMLLLLLVVGVGVAHAGPFDREEAKNVGYVNVGSTSTDAVIVAKPVYVFGVTIAPSSTNASVNLYDHATAAAQGTVKIELSSATAFESKHYIFNPPVKYDHGIYADVTSTGVTVEYR